MRPSGRFQAMQSAGPRRPRLVGRSLTARLLWLTMAIMLLIELLILMPSMGRERQSWLRGRVTQAHLAAFLVDKMPHDPGFQQEMLRLTGSEAIVLQGGSPAIVIPPGATLARADEHVALDHETLLTSMWRADLAVLGLNGRQVEVTATSPLQPDMTVHTLIDGRLLAGALRAYIGRLAVLSALIGLATSLVVFLALERMLVRPMRGLTASIVNFRRDPEHPHDADLAWLNGRSDDEVGRAARELSRMQEDLREVLWRNGRLATLGFSMAKIMHDLRNILASALIVGDRLQEAQDPSIRRAAGTLVSAVERATRLVGQAVDFVRDGPPPVERASVRLRAVVEEVAKALDGDGKVRVENEVPPQLVLALDRTQIYRVLINLLRNAIEAGATRVSFATGPDGPSIRLLVVDNGPGLPQKALENLFRPFTASGRNGGTGLGLTIARDLVRAHGGDLSLHDTGPNGTAFAVLFAAPEPQRRAVPPADTGADLLSTS